MDDSQKKAIMALADDGDNLSKAAKIRALYPTIEEATKKGVSRAAIVQELNRTGLAISMATFNSTLYRIKKDGKKSSPQPGSSSVEKIEESFLDFKKPATFKRTER
jgi:DNA-binding transcriptional regulator YdaS (Cro superfamily)